MNYNSFKNKLIKCDYCSFSSEEYKPVVPAKVDLPVEIMFIGENPSLAKDINKPFDESTTSGKSLKENYLDKLGLSREDVWITNLFKCKYPKKIYSNKKQKKNAIYKVAKTCAKKWLIKEISIAKPKVIVTLSAREVYERLIKIFNIELTKNFSKIAGKSNEVIINNQNIILFPMVHPSIINNSGRKKSSEKWTPLHLNDHIPKLKKIL